MARATVCELVTSAMTRNLQLMDPSTIAARLRAKQEQAAQNASRLEGAQNASRLEGALAVARARKARLEARRRAAEEESSEEESSEEEAELRAELESRNRRLCALQSEMLTLPRKERKHLQQQVEAIEREIAKLRVRY